MTANDWPALAQHLGGELRHLRGGAGDVMKGFSAIAQAALAPGALDVKTKELIALAISVATRCDDCIAFHAKAAVDRGATREEVLETLGMAIYMGAGPVGDVCEPCARRLQPVRRSENQEREYVKGGYREGLLRAETAPKDKARFTTHLRRFAVAICNSSFTSNPVPRRGNQTSEFDH